MILRSVGTWTKKSLFIAHESLILWNLLFQRPEQYAEPLKADFKVINFFAARDKTLIYDVRALRGGGAYSAFSNCDNY